MPSDAFKRYLKKKIELNMREYKRGRWVSPQQAVAVSYSQTRKKFGQKSPIRLKRKARRKK